MTEKKNISYILAIIILMITIALSTLISFRKQPVLNDLRLNRLPSKINGYNSIDLKFTDSVYEVLNTDASIYRHYSKKNRNQIHF